MKCYNFLCIENDQKTKSCKIKEEETCKLRIKFGKISRSWQKLDVGMKFCEFYREYKQG